MKAAYLKTTAVTTVAIKIPGRKVQTVRFEFPIGCEVAVCYEGEADNSGFKQWEAEDEPAKN